MPGYDPVRDADIRPEGSSPSLLHRRASIADLIVASQLTEADRERGQYSRDMHAAQEQPQDHSMSRSSSASGHGYLAAFQDSSSQLRQSPQLPRQSPRTERSPSMANLLNDGHAGAIGDRPRSGSHSSVTSQLSQHAHPPQHQSPLSHGGGPGYFSAPGHPYHPHARESPSSAYPRTGPSSVSGAWPSSPGAFPPQYSHPPPLPPPSYLNRTGSSPALSHIQGGERPRYMSQPGSTPLSSRPVPASLGYGSTSSSPSSAVHAHLHPSPSHRFAVPETRSPETRRIPLPLSPSSIHVAPHRSSYSSASGSSLAHPESIGHHLQERVNLPGDMLPPTSVSPRRNSVRVDTSVHHRYQPTTPGSGYPPTPGYHTSASPSFPTPSYATSRPAFAKQEIESNYFPQVSLESDDEYRRDSNTSFVQHDDLYPGGRERLDSSDRYRSGEHVTTPGSVQHLTSVTRHDSKAHALPSPMKSPSAARYDGPPPSRLGPADVQNLSPKPQVVAIDTANGRAETEVGARQSPSDYRQASQHGRTESSLPRLAEMQDPVNPNQTHLNMPVGSATSASGAKEEPKGETEEPLPRYAPTTRVSPPKLVMRPIQIEEIDQKRSRCRNPLRRDWEQKNQANSRDPLDQILRDFHSKLPARSTPAQIDNGKDASIRKRPPPDTLEDAEEVASHYNKRREVGIHGREESPIIGLRKFNNWIKSVLVGSFVRGRDPMMDGRARPRGGRILDLGCGKGGDLKKWEKVDPSAIVGADIAAISIQQAVARHSDNGNRFQADFFAFDCFSTPLSEAIPRPLLEPLFDNVTLQFCMHYAWESVQKARMMLDNVSRYLRPGGIFIGTIPDSTELRGRLSESSTLQDRSFGNQYYKVVFDQIESFPPFGNRYTFFLEDAVENVPEYVVDFDIFEDLAHEAGLRCIYRKNFADIYADGQGHPEFGRLLERMKVRNRDGTLVLDEDMWLAATLYLGFAFEKM